MKRLIPLLLLCSCGPRWNIQIYRDGPYGAEFLQYLQSAFDLGTHTRADLHDTIDDFAYVLAHDLA